MNKEQLIKKIGDVVMKNSKKGVLTTTKFVGTYNYKSGYDSYFAVSLDMNKVLVVYSYYQNDRGEHIDTPTYKLADLPEKELQEVYKNLNTEDADSLRYAAWSGTEEKNLAILTTLGIFKPKPVKNKIIDINAVPDLENPDDAYYIDRDENVHILKCLGKTIMGASIFDVEKDCEGDYDQPYHTDEPETFCKMVKPVKNKGIFMVVEGDDISEYKYLYVPDKKTLAKLIKKQQSYKMYYFINTMLESWKSEKCEKPKPTDGRFDFTDKEEAIAKFEEVRNDLLTQLKDAKAKLEKKMEKTKEASNGVKLLDYDDFHILPKNAVPGTTYYVEGKEKKYLGPFTVTSVNPERKYCTLDNGLLVYGWRRIITPENLEDYKLSKKYEKAKEYIDYIERALKYVDASIEFAEEAKPFVKDDRRIPAWVINDAIELSKKPVPSFKTVMT